MPSIKKLCTIAEFFDVSIDYLIGRVDSSKSIYDKDKVYQEIGKQFFEMNMELKRMGLTPDMALEVLKVLEKVNLIGKK